MRKSNLTVSVVIPTYNRAPLLARAIDSALAQLESEKDELIVVNDGSTDHTQDVLDRYAGRIRVIEGSHGGGGAARNLGVASATGDLIAFLDSDDEWMTGKLAAQRALLDAREDVLFAFGNMACSWLDGSVERRYLWSWHQDKRAWSEILPRNTVFSEIGILPEGWGDFHVYIGDLYSDLANRLYVLTSSCIVRRREAGDALYFDEDIPMYEDWACFGRLARVGPTAYMDTELTWQHGHEGVRLTDADSIIRSDCRLTILRRIWGDDREYQADHGDDYLQLVDRQLEHKIRTLVVRGELSAAREGIGEMQRKPLPLRILVRVPATIVRIFLVLWRFVRRLPFRDKAI